MKAQKSNTHCQFQMICIDGKYENEKKGNFSRSIEIFFWFEGNVCLTAKEIWNQSNSTTAILSKVKRKKMYLGIGIQGKKKRKSKYDEKNIEFSESEVA